MTDSGGSKPKKNDGRSKRAKTVGAAEPYETDDLIRALNHLLRRQILRLLHSSRKPLSPIQIERKLDLDEDQGSVLSSISYHVGILHGFKAIVLVDEQPRRGAVEHFYESTVSKSAWVRNLLKRMQKSDEGRLLPRGRRRSNAKSTKPKKS